MTHDLGFHLPMGLGYMPHKIVTRLLSDFICISLGLGDGNAILTLRQYKLRERTEQVGLGQYRTGTSDNMEGNGQRNGCLPNGMTQENAA